jgi:hypothetical protein
LSNLALELTGEVPCQDEAAETPELRKDITVDESDILNLTVET